jgi:AcrR family transcriptional regulator
MTRDRIFAASADILQREGLAGLSIRNVAKAVKLSPMAIYRHFTDKDDLIDALMLDGFAAWEAIAAAIRTKDPTQWLERLLEAFLDFALSQPHRFDAAFIFPARAARRYPDDFVAGRSPVLEMAYVRIEQAKAEGTLDDTPTPQIALTLSALAQGFVSMHRAKRFANEQQLCAAYRIAMRRAISSFAKESSSRVTRK